MSIELQFTKGQGTGNDFVIVADPEGEFEFSAAQVAWLCDRHFGVGADGLLRVVRSRAIPEGRAILAEDPDAEWFMDYRNADGSIAEMCGNGIRVFLHYLLERSVVDLPAGSTLALGTRAGIVDLARSSTGYQVDMGRWRLADERLVRSRGLEVPRPGLGIQLGNPHVVVALASEQELAELKLDEAPVLDPLPADGANVEFVVPAEPLVRDGVGQIRMRVHERGVGETLSCGTGAVAAALAARHWAGAGAPNHWRVQLPGGALGVRMIPTQEGEHVALSGPAALVFSGSVQLADD